MPLRVVELFSGIGGIHAALKATGLDFEVVSAADINPNANAVYSHNFPSVKCLNKNIESFDGGKLLGGVDLLTMSPPCQPFTRNGLKLDLNDARTKPFVSVLKALKEVEKPVPFVFVENVKGFDASEARDMLVETLTGRGYFVREFLLCPSQFEIANSRLRYYLIARLEKDFPFGTAGEIMADIPPGYKLLDRPDFFSTLLYRLNPPSCVDEVSIPSSTSSTERQYLTDSMLLKHANVLDIATSSSKRTCCFTKAYAHYLEGTGSVFADEPEKIDQVFSSLPSLTSDDDKRDALRSLKLRFFSAEEISRFMCFPREFSFPDDVSDKQRYRLLGNSVNVFVVGFLLKLLTCDLVDLKR